MKKVIKFGSLFKIILAWPKLNIPIVHELQVIMANVVMLLGH